ncbi:MAG: BACON domain-containing protein, partial [Bacteroidales bacterium]|nr:BACON domain-containing protein [Bacteroidales bacterium]
MSRRLVILCSFLALGTLLLSCEKEEERIPVLTLPSPMLTSAGGVQTLSVAAESSWKLSVEYLEGGSGWITTSAASGNGFESVTVTVAANETDSPRKAKLRLDTRAHSVNLEITQSANVSHSFPSWMMELPAPQENDDLMFFIHDMKGGTYVDMATSGTRNWSFYWDSKNYVSIWVAYPLNAGLLEGNYGRYDIFIDDPILTELKLKQPYLTGGSYGGGWTR